MKVLYAVAAWGLGHATRSLPLIRGLLSQGHEVTVLSSGRALRLLRSELKGRCAFIEVQDVSPPLSRWPPLFYAKATLSLPLVYWHSRREQLATRRLLRTGGFDRIISDGRYGVLTKEVPSYSVLHSLRQIITGRPRLIETVVERVQHRVLSNARKILVPDYRDDGLAGDLCHNLDSFSQDQLEYIGILSGLRRTNVQPDIDYFISVSGAEPQRTIFEEIVLEQARDLHGRVVIALGKPDVPRTVADDDRITVHSYMTRQQQEEMMNRARMVISRSGYTTLMELAELGKTALLTPTAGQSEQEYLAAYHEQQGTVHSVAQDQMNLGTDVIAAQGYSGLETLSRTDETVKNFLRVIAA